MRKKVIVILFMLMYIPFIYAEDVIEDKYEEVTIEEEVEEDEELETEGSGKSAEECEVNEAFIQWINMDAEKRKEYDMPPYCKSDGLASIDVGKDKIKSFNKGVSDSYYLSPYASIVKNQEETGTCWAFAATTVTESYMRSAYDSDVIYSPGHLNYMESQSFYDISSNKQGIIRGVNAGGNWDISSQYYINRFGPVYESDFYTYTGVAYLPRISSKTVIGKKNRASVNKIEYEYRGNKGACTSAEKTRIKTLISNYGAVGASMYISGSYYNYANSTYMFKDNYDTYTSTNHSITIVGWDDNFPVSKFSGNYFKPSNNGAWIVQNSYGTGWGNNGLFYISYEDDEICTNIFSIRDADLTHDNYSYIHVHDFLQNYASAPAVMNVFNKKNTGTYEILGKVSFELQEPGSYEVYYYAGNAKGVSLSKMKKIASGTNEYRGWTTVYPDTKILIPKNQKQFSIAVYHSSYKHAIANKKQLTFNDNGEVYYANSTDTFKKGMSYLYYGNRWRDLYDWYNNGKFKAAISAFTEIKTVDVKSVTPKYTFDDYIDFTVKVKAVNSGTITKMQIVKNGVIIAEKDSINKAIKKGSTYTLTMRKSGLDDLINGKYEIRVHTNNKLYNSKTFTIKMIPIREVYFTNSAGLKVEEGKTIKLNAVTSPGSNNVTPPGVHYSSSDNSIATVDDNGVVTGIKTGNVTINAVSNNDIYGYYELEVIKHINQIETNTSELLLEVGNSGSIYFDVKPDDTTDAKTVTWVSSDPEVASIEVISEDTATVHALKSGICKITGTSVNGITKEVMVLVKGFGITPMNLKLELNKSKTMKANIINDLFEVSNNVTWSSSKIKIAPIDQSGKITAKKVGATTISATDELGNVVKTKVTVTKIQATSLKVTGTKDVVYTGSSFKPTVKVTYKGKTLSSYSDYSVSYGTNKYPGKGIVKVTAKPSSKLYEGTKKIIFVIKPGQATISKLTTGENYVKVKFNLMNKVTKYQIQYKVKEDSAWRTINVTSNTKTISNLFKGFEYQVRVRGYVTVDGKNYYGAWSKVKSIKCK